MESERNMLFDSKENLSRQVFDKRVELRCLEIDCDVKEKALEESRRSLSEMLKSSERNEEWIRAIADLSDEDIEATRRGVKNFDYLFEKLTERTDTESARLSFCPEKKRFPARRRGRRISKDGLPISTPKRRSLKKSWTTS